MGAPIFALAESMIRPASVDREILEGESDHRFGLTGLDQLHESVAALRLRPMCAGA